jgi:hypothetical protein
MTRRLFSRTERWRSANDGRGSWNRDREVSFAFPGRIDCASA